MVILYDIYDFLYTVPIKSIHTPSFFSRFVMLQPYVKLLWITFFHINLHLIHHNDQAETELSQLHKCIKNKKNWNEYP